MKDETKILLIKLFRNYQTIGAVSGNAYLTFEDFIRLIHDKSFPVDKQISRNTSKKI